MSAVGAQAHDVLKEDLIVGCIRTRAILGVLQPEAAEFGRRIIDHRGGSSRMIIRQLREVAGVQTSAEHGRSGIEPIMAQAGAPAGYELIDTLQIPAGLCVAIAAAISRAVDIVRQATAIGTTKIFALQLQVGLDGIAVWRPFVNCVGNQRAAVAGKRIQDLCAGGVGIVESAAGGGRTQVRQAGAVAGRFPDVVTDMGEHRSRADAVAVAIIAWESGPAP